jgi:hypothetical protein
MKKERPFITHLKVTIRYLKRNFDVCKDFDPTCYQCQVNTARLMLEHIVDNDRWFRKQERKKDTIVRKRVLKLIKKAEKWERKNIQFSKRKKKIKK